MTRRPSMPDEKLREIIATAASMLSDNDQVVADVAAQFCAMSDDGQAQFFTHVARIFGEWGYADADTQRCMIAGHLIECECSTPEAREWIKSLAGFIEMREQRSAGAGVS